MLAHFKMTIGTIVMLALLTGSDVQVGIHQSKKKASQKFHQVFGITIRKPTLSLKARVENLYGKPLCVASYEDKAKCGTVTDDPIEGSTGASMVSAEGAPVILLSETGKNESTLVHELFHLKLKAEGYPILQYNIHKELNRDVINLLVALIFNALEHRICYPEMRKMGIDPDELESVNLIGLCCEMKSHKYEPTFKYCIGPRSISELQWNAVVHVNEKTPLRGWLNGMKQMATCTLFRSREE